MHLNSFNAEKLVSIGEDATRVIARVEYDCESNKLIGFVLPCDENGLPIREAFTATTFESIEDAFRTGAIAKYAFAYMVQPLSQNVPAFCLCCLGSDNKFDTTLVLNRWKYIFNECNKRGITVISFGADGDTRELKAMQLSTKLCFSNSQKSCSGYTKIDLQELNIPTTWSSWFAIKHPTTVAYVQDVVHVAVKLKSRLLKPSIILPLGKFLAGAHDFRLIQSIFSKDQHGLTERDVNHKDRQNVLHLISDSVIGLLSQIPDAKGTLSYLKVIKCVVDSYQDKSLDPLAIERTSEK